MPLVLRESQDELIQNPRVSGLPGEHSSPCARTIAPRLLYWFAAHGRKDLPWQQDRTPYRVWVSEIMLQQTQVATVTPYYERFMSIFPTIDALASASLDEVLHLWTGLGYYARARNLHRAARIVVDQHDGCVPEDIESLQGLPGIGRSTAGAILALSRGSRHPILDGNARRVLARYFGIEGHISRAETLARLWALADACTPGEGVAEYTQAIMDLGSAVCTRTRPACDACPLTGGCVARASGRQASLPSPRPRRTRPHREAIALIAVRHDGAVLLEDRPPEGLWGGLASLPMFESPAEATVWCEAHFGPPALQEAMPAYEHAFTHFDLKLRPVLVRIGTRAVDIEGHRWYAGHERIGLSKPAVDLVRVALQTTGTETLPSQE